MGVCSCSCLAEDKTLVLLCLTITSCSAQGPIFSYWAHLFFSPGPIFPPTSTFPWDVDSRNLHWGDEGQRSSLSQHLECWHGTQRPCLIGDMELSPCLIKGPQRWLLWLFPQDLFRGVAVIALGASVFYSLSLLSWCKSVVIWRRQVKNREAIDQ